MELFPLELFPLELFPQELFPWELFPWERSQRRNGTEMAPWVLGASRRP